MSYDAYICAAVLIVAFMALLLSRWPADFILLSALGIMVLLDIVDIETAVAGWANQSVLTVAALYVLAEGVRRSGALALLTKPLLLQACKMQRLAMSVLLFPVALLSAFINNTPVVAMLIPSVKDWAKEQGFSRRSVLMPLSFAAILGGTCTIIGSSTNLLVAAMVWEHSHIEIDFFALTPIGLSAAVIGILYLIICAPFLLKNKEADADVFEHPEEFTLEFLVKAGSPLIGQPLGEVKVGLKQGLTPAEIVRGDTLIPAPQSGELIQENDRLIFAGPAVELLAVHQIQGLDPAEDRLFGHEPGRARRVLVSVVLAARSPLVGTRIGEGRFRRHYGGAVMAVARSGERISAADQAAWTFKAGDTLLIEARHDFIDQQSGNRDFYVVSNYDAPVPDQQWRAMTVLALVIGLMVVVAFGLVPMLLGAAVVSIIFYALGVYNSRQARSSIDLQVIAVMAAAIGIGSALQATGIVSLIAESILDVGSPQLALALLFLATALLTELISNAAAAAVMTPIALSLAVSLGGSPIPWALTVMMAASASFITPLGYQTNLMVYGPGNYRFRDFLIVGLPLTIMVAALTIWIAPMLGPITGPLP